MLFREETMTIRNVAELLATCCSDEMIDAILDGLASVDDRPEEFDDHTAAVANELLSLLMDHRANSEMVEDDE